MLCHHYKCIFIHIPKNAGQSIEHVFLDLLDLTWKTRAPLLLRPKVPGELGPNRLAHLKAHEYLRYKYVSPEMFEEYFKFCFVRNPWSRVVSIYKYLGFNNTFEFNEFVATVLKERVLKQDKDQLFGPQTEFILDNQENILVDFIGKFENLQNDFNYVCKQIGIPETTVPHVNTSKGNSTTSTKKPSLENDIPSYKQYQDYYNQESIDLIANIYKRDIEMFKYDFNK